MKKVLLLMVVFALLLSTALVSCGKQAAEEPADTAEPAETTEAAEEPAEEPAKEMTLTMMDIWGETEIPYQAFEDAIASFEADNPGVTIDREMIPQETYLVQIPTLATANDLPDIVATNGSMTRLFASTGALLNLQPYIDADPEWQAKVQPSAWVEHKFNGDAYSMGFDSGNYGYILYNTAIFEEVGITEFPKNLDELHVACDKLKAAGYTPLALGDAELWPADSINFSSFVNNFVGNAWTEAIFYKTGEAAFTDQEFIDALAAFQDLALKGYFNDNLVSITHNDSLALYMQGKAAIRGTGDWEDTLIVDQVPEIAAVTEVAAWPGPAEGAKATNSYEASSAWGIAIGSGIEEDAIPYAISFLSKYMGSEEWCRYLIEEKYKFSPFTMPEFDESKLPELIAKRVAFTQDATACLNWDAILDASVKDIYQRGLQSLLIGEMTPQELAENMQAEYEMVQ